MAEDVAVRRAGSDDRVAIGNVLDGAYLALDDTMLKARLDAGDCYVAESDTGTVLGALVCDGTAVCAVAVRPRRRGRGIGSQLVRAALADRDRLVAEFDPGVREFWEELGFDIDAVGEGDRLRGRRSQES